MGEYGYILTNLTAAISFIKKKRNSICEVKSSGFELRIVKINIGNKSSALDFYPVF